MFYILRDYGGFIPWFIVEDKYALVDPLYVTEFLISHPSAKEYSMAENAS